jgi:SAM-dependent methyltransferase
LLKSFLAFFLLLFSLLQGMHADSLIVEGCVVCGTRTFDVVCSAADVATQFQFVNAFHQRRLYPKRLDGRSDNVLADRASFTQDYATNIVSCTHCGLVYRTPRPSARAITQAYQHDHYSQERLTALFAAQLELYRSKARRLHHWLPKERVPRIVEVGSFVGGFLAAGQEHGWEMLGIDPGEEVGAFCEQKRLRVVRSTLAEVPLKKNSVDCVAIWNTFDQLPQPEETLTAACQLLRPGGVLVIRVPNGKCFRWGIKQIHRAPQRVAEWLRVALAWNNLLAFPYLYGYSMRTLDRLVNRCGFTRIAVHPDMLMPLADRQTKPWAVWEERFFKGVHRMIAQIESFLPASHMTTAPWLDTYYRFTILSETSPQLRLNVPFPFSTSRWCVAS